MSADVREPKPAELEWPAPAWVLEKLIHGRAAVDPRALRALLNATFGPAGWDVDVIEPGTVVADEVHDTKAGKRNRVVLARATARITVRSGSGPYSRTSTGTMLARAGHDKEGGIAAVELAVKGAETNAFKRAAARIGRRFGSDCGDESGGYERLVEVARAHALAGMEAAGPKLTAAVERIGKLCRAGKSDEARAVYAEAQQLVEDVHRRDPATSEEWRTGWRRAMQGAARANGGTG